jgi:hypothetical protein
MIEGSETPTAKYFPGSWVAVAGGRAWLLIDVESSSPIVEACWSLLRADAPLDAILSQIVMGGFAGVRSFALVGVFGTSRRAIVRGQATARLVTADDQWVSVEAADAATWIEREIAGDVVGIVLTSPAEPGTVSLPLSSGVTLASAVDVRLLTATTAQEVIDSPTAVSRIDPQSAEPEPEAHLEPEPELGAAPTSRFDHLFGATQHPPVALEPEVADTPDEDSSVVSLSEQPAPGAVTLMPTDAEYPRRSSDSGLIDAVPWADLDGLEAEPSVAAVTELPDITATDQPVGESLVTSADPQPAGVETVNRSALLAAQSAAAFPTGPTVLAARCPSGHVSPAYAGSCRVCREPLPAQDPFVTARPVLGALRFSTGDVVSLDRGVVMGRAPRMPDVNDPQRPHVVQLASPSDEISRTHLEVRLDGWHVIVVDLGSTNGTMVTPPGQDTTKLRENDPLVIEPGTVVSLADEVSFEFEATA